jgi:hypothetical protein
VSIARSGTGGGYWLLGRDGGVFAYGTTPYFGGAAGTLTNKVATSIIATAPRILTFPTVDSYRVLVVPAS